MSKKFSGECSLQVHFQAGCKEEQQGWVQVQCELQGQAFTVAGPCASLKGDAHHSGAYLLWMMIEGLSKEMLFAE